MALTFDAANLVIESTASITDLPVFHAALRDWEDSAAAAVYPVTHKWKALDLGSGAFFYQADLINGWQIKFVGAGPFQVNGNLKGTIIATGVQVERITSAAFVTTAQGGSGPSAANIAAAVRTELAAELAQLTKVSKIHGVGVPLIVTPASRTAGDVVQTITTVGDTTTVSAA